MISEELKTKDLSLRSDPQRLLFEIEFILSLFSEKISQFYFEKYSQSLTPDVIYFYKNMEAENIKQLKPIESNLDEQLLSIRDFERAG